MPVEGKFRFDAYLDDVGAVAGVGVELRMLGVVDDHLVGYEDRAKPCSSHSWLILVLGILDVVGDAGIHDREVGDVFVQCLLVEEVLLHVSLHARFRFLERFESCLGSSVGKQVLAGLHQVGGGLDVECRY